MSIILKLLEIPEELFMQDHNLFLVFEVRELDLPASGTTQSSYIINRITRKRN